MIVFSVGPQKPALDIRRESLPTGLAEEFLLAKRREFVMAYCDLAPIRGIGP
jgi:hypothetical protein